MIGKAMRSSSGLKPVSISLSPPLRLLYNSVYQNPTPSISLYSKPLKLDDFTTGSDKARFARICVELHFFLPLETGMSIPTILLSACEVWELAGDYEAEKRVQNLEEKLNPDSPHFASSVGSDSATEMILVMCRLKRLMKLSFHTRCRPAAIRPSFQPTALVKTNGVISMLSAIFLVVMEVLPTPKSVTSPPQLRRQRRKDLITYQHKVRVTQADMNQSPDNVAAAQEHNSAPNSVTRCWS